ncbi:DeoR/GlpR family DNA-binding transcription regulator [Cohnella hashimotonis]|uniref:DeoR/GlpR family DNA-binding transcription regulator n=1 Tax=Cohnella hashimotonis TaxID=2826895 RepID=A0ABT6TAU2_9BACL|nr:DeoR/GlpR family DNA-binding transcription regulator [Cohnella hashimotonis]MDI4643889.1 DeoR/GlpR family DNA-binding transcription regulator [Cohnella hashimotonis]
MIHNQADWNARQRQIHEQIAQSGEVRISELSERYGVTEMTIRRDLEKLEEGGSVRRTFGGAIYVYRDVALQDRTGLYMDEKVRIGRQAASLIAPGESVFLDGGTTTLQIARALRAGQQITVVTNALNIAAELASKQIPTIMTGGMLLESTHSLVGPIAAQSLSGMAFDRAFLGATGLSEAHGFSNSNLYEAEIKRIAVRQARETTVVLDRTKFGARVLVSFAGLADVKRIVTDLPPDGELARACAEAEVRIEVAE